MSSTCIVLALVTGVDVDGLRQLHDYGRLGDADVVRAFEQTRLQRFGHVGMPAYLKRIEQLACVVDDGRIPRLMIFQERSDEARLLNSLQDGLRAVKGPCVVWDASELCPLTARAMRHGRVLPTALRNASALALANVLAADTGDASDPAEAEADITTLLGLDAKAESTTTAMTRALNRYRLWLAWQYSQGGMTAEERDTRQQTIAEAQRPSPLPA